MVILHSIPLEQHRQGLGLMAMTSRSIHSLVPWGAEPCDAQRFKDLQQTLLPAPPEAPGVPAPSDGEVGIVDSLREERLVPRIWELHGVSYEGYRHT